jgi:hypothetical protein
VLADKRNQSHAIFRTDLARTQELQLHGKKKMGIVEELQAVVYHGVSHYRLELAFQSENPYKCSQFYFKKDSYLKLLASDTPVQ